MKRRSWGAVQPADPARVSPPGRGGYAVGADAEGGGNGEPLAAATGATGGATTADGATASATAGRSILIPPSVAAASGLGARGASVGAAAVGAMGLRA
jgi:hypothetical protein